MRKRINRLAIASSDNYSNSKKAHRAMLVENHENNSSLFLMVNSSIETPKINDLEEFETNLRRQIELFKSKKS